MANARLGTRHGRTSTDGYRLGPASTLDVASPRHAAFAATARLDGVTSDRALDDGTYDALVVEASEGDEGSVSVELTIVTGPAKGEVVTLRAVGLGSDPLDLLGVPATLTVLGGAPAVRFEL
jgi:hypothetical protein